MLLSQFFLTLAGLVYQVMVPMWSRAWRFANVYAYAAIDLLFTVLWFAAFVAVAVWQAGGVKKSTDKNQSGKGGGGDCDNFAYGSASKCETAKASVGFGVIVWLLFACTSGISIYGLLKYKKTGIMPYSTSDKHGEAVVVEDPNKDPWSTNTDELDQQLHPNRESGDEADLRRAYGQPLPEEDGLLPRPSRDDPFHDAQETHSMLDTQTEEGAHPGRPLSFQSSSELSIATAPPAYQEADQLGINVISPSGYVAPSALSPSDYTQTPGGRVNFPTGNYGADFR